MSIQAQFNDIWNVAFKEALRFDVVRAVALRHAWATALMWYWYGAGEPQRPDVISGYRSPARQAQLLQRWQSGHREGIRAKPACQSWHMVGRAIDVENNRPEWLEVYGALMVWLGMRWGRTFGDPNHFDYPGPNEPPNICVA